MDRVIAIYEQAGASAATILTLEEGYDHTDEEEILVDELSERVLTTPLLRQLIAPFCPKLESIGFHIRSADCSLNYIIVRFRSLICRPIRAEIVIENDNISAMVGIPGFDIDHYIKGSLYGHYELERKSYLRRCHARFASLQKRTNIIFATLPQPIAEEIALELSIEHIYVYPSEEDELESMETPVKKIGAFN